MSKYEAYDDPIFQEWNQETLIPKTTKKVETVIRPSIQKPTHQYYTFEEMNQLVRDSWNEPNLSCRIWMLEDIKKGVVRASIPYIDFLIRKHKAKLENYD